MKWVHMTVRTFRSGDRVLLEGKLGTIVTIFPDGIHLVRLDETGKVMAATVAQLELAGPHHRQNRTAGYAG